MKEFYKSLLLSVIRSVTFPYVTIKLETLSVLKAFNGSMFLLEKYVKYF
jgi:hypothetical protein